MIAASDVASQMHVENLRGAGRNSHATDKAGCLSHVLKLHPPRTASPTGINPVSGAAGVNRMTGWWAFGNADFAEYSGRMKQPRFDRARIVLYIQHAALAML